MNEIKIYLRPSGSLAYLYKDFDLYEGCYRNSQLTVFVPKSLLYENENGTFVNLVKTGAILTAPNGSKLTTKSYYLDYERDQTIGGVEFRVYTTITPKEFCVYAGTQTVVVNVESIDNTTPDAQTIISVTTTQTADLIVLESAYLGQDEPIDPTELDKIKATLTEIQSEIGGLPNKYVTVDTNQTISGNKTHTGINTFNGFTSINGVGIDADAIVKGSDRFKYPVKSGTLALTSDIPENIVTTDTDQTIDGTKAFTSPITVGGQTWRTSYMKDSFVYTVDGYSYEVTYPEKSGLMALKSDIPTDYATQGQLAQTNQNVEDLYTILEQAQVVTVTTLEQAYTTRETADGENIVDGVQTTVKEIRGKTVATENLIPYPYEESTKTENGITFTVNSDGSITANGTTTVNPSIFNVAKISLNAGTYALRSFVNVANAGICQFYIDIPSEPNDRTGNGVTFTLQDDIVNKNVNIIVNPSQTVNNLVFRPMLNAGTTAKPYSKGFAGLKNAFFKEIVSTGKNLNGGENVLAGELIESVTTGNIIDQANYNTLLLPVKAGETYRLTGYTNNSGVALRYVIYDRGMNVIAYGSSEPAVTIPENGAYLGCSYYNQNAEVMCERGATATAYEPYISDTLSAETPIELAEYDVVYPGTGETKRQSKTVTFNGTEAWVINTNYTAFSLNLPSKGIAFTSVCAPYSAPKITSWDQLKDYEAQNGVLVLLIKDSTYSTVEAWKAHLAELAAAGNPLTVTYKTVEATTEATPFNKSKYKAWKNGSETIEQGPTDNSEYGAEDTVKQDYFTLTGGTTNG